MNAADIAMQLALQTEAVASALLGKPSSRSRAGMRWGRRGSLSVRADGRWYDHELGEGGDLLDLVHREIGGSIQTAMGWSRHWLGDGSYAPKPRAAPAVAATDARDDRIRAEAAGRIWALGIDAQGTLVERYLVQRGLSLPPAHHQVIRFAPTCPLRGESAPCMLALLRDIHTDEPCGIHRTALLKDGAGRDKVRGRAMLGRASGALIKLTPDTEVSIGLGVAEGVETALAVLAAGWAPIWAAGSAGAIANLPVLAGIEALTVFADHDPAGQRSARACAERWAAAGCEALIRYPHAQGHDWCDEPRAA